MPADDKARLRADVADRIVRLNRDAAHLAPREVMRQLHAIRVLSRGGGLAAVAALAVALADDLAAHGAEAAIHAYLDRMADAVDLDGDEQPRFVDLALASILAGWAFA